jgi:hypothetical protein
VKEDLRGYPLLQAIDRLLDVGNEIHGISQPAPVAMLQALASLQQERKRLSFLQRQVYAVPDELQRGDWVIVRGALREAAANVRRATGAAQDPSWMNPAIQIAEDRSKHRMESAGSSADLVIFSEAEMTANDGAGFWSNVDGWSSLEAATRFSSGERDRLYMPNSRQQDARSLSYGEAEAKVEAYLDATEGLELARPR